ncbi:FG-GAP repeat domain-containing protein [Sorangium sp. KYC3313]|uniref:FG-GAP repeat domain-containing protein n=1 Tax=Sorangium sp. KYC3313 TaxID=3449740 RepID=UPI003F89AACE
MLNPFGSSLVATDLNGDGHTDLAVGYGSRAIAPESGGVSALLNHGDGTFDNPDGTFGAGEHYGAGHNSLATADFDGDGRPDVAMIDTVQTGPGVRVLYNRCLP